MRRGQRTFPSEYSRGRTNLLNYSNSQNVETKSDLKRLIIFLRLKWFSCFLVHFAPNQPILVLDWPLVFLDLGSLTFIFVHIPHPWCPGSHADAVAVYHQLPPLLPNWVPSPQLAVSMFAMVSLVLCEIFPRAICELTLVSYCTYIM